MVYLWHAFYVSFSFRESTDGRMLNKYATIRDSVVCPKDSYSVFCNQILSKLMSRSIYEIEQSKMLTDLEITCFKKF